MTVATYPNVDDVLGPADTRFFGSRYADVAARLTDFEIGADSDGHSCATGLARVDIRGPWSRKGEVDQSPHLSTVDILSLTMQLVDATTAAVRGPAASSLYATRVGITAPTAPVDADLDRLPVEVEAHVGDGAIELAVSVAGFAVRMSAIAIPHPAAAMRPVAEPARRSVYADLFRQRVPTVTGVRLADDRPAGPPVGRATVTLPEAADGPAGGVDAVRGAGVNQVDAFVAALQLGQVLLYRQDRMKRAESDTLWMRRTTIEAVEPRAAVRHAELSVALEDSRLRELRGDTWRLATIAARLSGLFRIDCAVAHRVPAALATPGARR
jgi:hypothetical protein